MSRPTSSPYPGDTDRTVDERAFVMHTWTVQADWGAPTLVGGEGALFWDDQDNTYIDMSSMAECSNLGHQHPRVVEAIRRQAAELCFATSAWGAKPRAELAAHLIELSGYDGGRVFFTLAGADANENAVKLARWATNKPVGKIITRYRSYHGATLGAMEFSGDNRGWVYAPGTPNVVHAVPPYCYRCPLGLAYDKCGIRCADHVADLIEWEGPKTVSAVLMEPHAGTNGVVAPPEYWPRLREICSRYNILLIADEVMSGFGRVGHWFAWQEYGEEGRPDLMTLAKGLTGAHLPLGAVVVSRKVAEQFESQMLYSGMTYSGHPLACAAGLAALNAYRDEDLIARSHDLGARMHSVLQFLEESHPSIGDIRGQGLFAVIELVKNRRTREPLSPWPQTAPSLRRLVDEGRTSGVSFAVRGNLIILAPPLNIEQRHLIRALEVLDKLLPICDAEVARAAGD
ncbi:MAG TPA: aminotransferase class III-fold pyridoxal phosphate-dependent enzyme [Anaerolineae bacterium]|nr:aminotransferase class III-fold pyridoxal phosphate-dependent enzyme [Anaerolineae bacterium]